MSRFVVNGGRKLNGSVVVQGSKNSVLPLLAASLLTDGESVLYACPRLSDVDAALRILRWLGCKAVQNGETVLIDNTSAARSNIPDELMREMRGSIIFLGAMLARFGEAELSFPGGCALGPRPIDMHLKALRLMGAEISERGGVLSCSAPDGLYGAKITLSFPSVGATENVILAAVTADGTTTLTNAAREPEISDLCEFLTKAGARIYGAGEGTIVIDGVKSLKSVEHTVIPDRIAAATLMAAAAATGSEITLKGTIRSHLGSVIAAFEEMGCRLSVRENEIRFKSPKVLKPVQLLRTMPYPGFPTDAQAPIMAAACVAKGTSVIVENIFENRYRHVDELTRLGADIMVQGKVAVVSGARRLYGAPVEAQDLRGAAGLVVAALAAEGTTDIGGISYLERGYDSLEQTLCSLGADVVKI